MGIAEKTLEVRTAEFTRNEVGDAPMLPELLDQIPPEQVIASVTADGALDIRKCRAWGCGNHHTAQQRQAMERRHRRGRRKQ